MLPRAWLESGRLITRKCQRCPCTPVSYVSSLYTAAKKSRQKKAAHTASPGNSHGPPTSPSSTRQRSTWLQMPARSIGASPALRTRTTVSLRNPSRPPCGKRCVGCRTTNVGAQNVFLARTACFTVRKPTHSLPQMGAGNALAHAVEEVTEAGEALLGALATNKN